MTIILDLECICGALTAPTILNNLNETAKVVENVAYQHFHSLLDSNCQEYEESPFLELGMMLFYV